MSRAVLENGKFLWGKKGGKRGDFLSVWRILRPKGGRGEEFRQFLIFGWVIMKLSKKKNDVGRKKKWMSNRKEENA